MALRHDQHRRTLTPRAGVLDAIRDLRTAGYAIGVLTDCTAETPQLWPSLPYAAVVDPLPSHARSATGSRIPLATTKSPGSSASRPASASMWATGAATS